MLVVEINKKYLMGFKVAMIMISVPFVIDAYEIYKSGSYINKDGFEYIRGESRGYYSFLVKKAVYASFFIWLGTFGSKCKATDESKDGKE